jgi:helix-turn-helix protein
VAVMRLLVASLQALVSSRAALMAENLALRQQLNVMQRSVKRPRLRWRDRVFWVWLSRLWQNWRSCLIVVQPATVIGWHRQGFKLYWRWKSRSSKVGRPPLDAEIRQLIRRMCRENATWGAPRIQSELALLGHEVAESTVATYMVRGGVRGPAEESRVRSPSNAAGHRLLLLASEGNPGYHVGVESFLARFGLGWSSRYGHAIARQMRNAE